MEYIVREREEGENKKKLSLMAKTCYSSYSGDWGKRIPSSRPAWTT